MYMNRAMRRAIKQGKKPLTEKVVSLPPILDEWTIFNIPQSILEKLQNGEIEAVRGVPVFVDNTGELEEVCPALNGWIFTWKRIDKELNLGLNLKPLERISNKLNAAMPLTENEVAQGMAALNAIRAAFRVTDRQRIKSITVDAQIAIFQGCKE